MPEITKEIRRFDNIDHSEWMTTPFERTTEGFLKGRAIVTCCGVFTYKRADGTLQRELRLPEEVFAPATLESLKLKPVTLNHPTELVTPENADMLQVGSLGDNPSCTNQEYNWNGEPTDWKKLTDGLNVAVDMIITKKDAIDAVINGKQGLSMGYTCDIEMAEPGSTWCGVEYDYIQRNIKYNHCAIVDAGRAGDNAKIELRVDSADAVLEDKLVTKDGGTKMLKKINLDGIDYEAEESVIKALNTEKKRADDAVAELSKFKEDSAKELSVMTAERDTQKERADKAEEDLAKAKAEALDSTKLDEAVNARINLYKNAEKAGVEVKNDIKDADIKKAVIAKVFPKANLDGKDSAYIDARYDATVEMLAERADSNSRQVLADTPNNHADSVDDARQRMIDKMKKDSRHEQEEK
jgi:hypothetical protein